MLYFGFKIMNNEAVYFINVFSTLSAAIPLGIGLLIVKKGASSLRYFLAFLAVGFLVDLLGWYNAHYPNNGFYSIVRTLYWLIDLTFYAFFLRWVANSRVVRVICQWVFLGLVLLWVAQLFEYSLLNTFKLSLGVAYSFIAGFVLLELIENKRGDGLPLVFWLVFGIFFYHFCTFFVMGMITTSTGNKIWWLHNAVNITTNIIYALGFWVCRDEFAAAKVGGQTLSNT